MHDYPVKLGMRFDGPVDPTPLGEGPEVFPSTRLELPEGVELPDEGTITFRYRTSREVDDKRTEKCCYELDLISIEGVKGRSSKSEGGYESVSDRLDKLKAELESAEEAE